MANLSEQESWIDGIYQLETSDPVVAGPGGISNRQAEQLASRTAYLKKMQETTGESLQVHLAASDPHSQYAPKNSPALTGTPTAPTTAQTANNTQIATTAFVKSALAALVNGSPAALDTLQELANALGNDPHFSTTVVNAIADVKTDVANKLNAHASILDAHPQYAPKASPAFTGTPTAPTAASSSNDTQLATTAFVKAAVAALVNGSPAALDTLQELATALGNDPNFSTTMLNALAGKLAKDQNGADIPDKARFLSTLVYRGELVNGGTFAACNQVGVYRVGINDGNTVTDMPKNIRGEILYSYGFLLVDEIAGVISQIYLPHRGPVATRQNWGGNSYSLGWNVMLDGLANKPSATDIGALPTAGTAAAATKLATARKINGVAFDGTTDITLPLDFPAGAPIPYPLSTPPAGWIKCNGQSFDKSQYPILASLYPSGFLPDLRGEFVRGWDDGRGADAGRALLSAQGDAIRNITGSLFYGYDADTNVPTNNSSTGATYYDTSVKIPDTDNYMSVVQSPTAMHWYPSKFDASRVVPTANETRPRNIAFNYIVRAA
ncbi:tail fiber protein [Pectobacterium parvum]|uniref:phage tail protein n=1 Tax=Pectobacterium parvum TaxID=2778550 RepID=UPI000506A8AF|nr:phage tail protein [Pectobacterium parvum]KFX14811.1 tail fiber protein [Pectobacterium parvum]